MNACDVGVFCMPPININARYALPNKFFDFVQARLAVGVGPAEEMARLTEKLGLGVVSTDFSEASFTEALAGWTPRRCASSRRPPTRTRASSAPSATSRSSATS